VRKTAPQRAGRNAKNKREDKERDLGGREERRRRRRPQIAEKRDFAATIARTTTDLCSRVPSKKPTNVVDTRFIVV
jgi:hypothetical protein